MANDQESPLDEIKRLTGGGGTAVAEPEEKEESPVDEIKRLTSGASRQTFAPQSPENARETEEIEQRDIDSQKQAKEITPSLLPWDVNEEGQPAKNVPQFKGPGTAGIRSPQRFPQPMIPMEPPGPHAVPGVFGQPMVPTIPPQAHPAGAPVATIAPVSGVAQHLDALYGRLRDAIAPQKFDAEGNPVPNIGEVLGGPVLGPVKVGAGLAHLFGTQTGPISAVSAARMGEPRAAEATMSTEQTEKNRLEAINGFNEATGGAFQTLAPLAVLDPAAIGAMPLYGAAASAGQKALTKAGMKPETAEAVTNLALTFGPGIFHAARIETPTDPVRDFAVGIMHESATKATAEYPNFVNMDPKAQEGILTDAENKTWTELMNANKRTAARFAGRIGMDPAKLYDFIQQAKEDSAAAPTFQHGLPQAPGGPGVQESTQEPPAPTPVPPQADITRFANEEQGIEATVTPMSKGFAVHLHDSDAGITHDTVHIFSDHAKATAYAQKLVGQQQAPNQEAEGTSTEGERPSELSAPAPQSPTQEEPAERETHSLPPHEELSDERDELFDDAVKVVQEFGKFSTPTVQRRLGLGYGRASRLIDQMKAAGIEPTKPESQAPPMEPPSSLAPSAELAKTGEPGVDRVFTPRPEDIEKPAGPLLPGGEGPSEPAMSAVAPQRTPPARSIPTIPPYARQQAQLYVNRLKNLVKREYAQSYLESAKKGIAPPKRPQGLTVMDAQAVRQNLEEYLKKQPEPKPESRFPPEIIDEANQEISAAQHLWSSLPAPGRFERVSGVETGEERGEGFYGIKSPRTAVELQFPWLKDAPFDLAAFTRAAEKGSGALHDRILNRVAEHVAARREQSAPILGEYRDELTDLAEQLRDTDPDAAAALDEIASGRYNGISDFRAFVEEKLNDAHAAANFASAVDELAAAERGDSLSESTEEGPEPGSEAGEEEGILPGFSQAVAEQRAAAGRAQSERLTKELNKPAESIEAAAGEMESKSPLFRGTAASPQEEMFAASKPVGEGPGTPSAQQPSDITESPMKQLTDAVGRAVSAKSSPEQRIKRAAGIARAAARMKGIAEGAVSGIKSVAAAVNTFYTKPPEWTSYKDAKGEYNLAMQRAAHEINNFVTKMKREFPSVERRGGMAAFVEAGGDEEKLREWARESKDPSAYTAALDLTDAEKTTARNVHQFQNERAEYAIQQGIMEHAVENYVMHVWERQNKFTRGVVNVIRTKMLQPNPSFAKKRIFPTFFDGEKAGFKAKTKDIAELAAAHDYALNEAIAARAFIKSMLKGKADDGRPLGVVSGSGLRIPEPTDEDKAFYLVNPNTKPEAIADYRNVDHPALRGWKWAGKDSDGNPLFVKGDIVIHPDVLRDLRNVLGSSALRSYTVPGTDIAPLNEALKLSTEFKNTLLSLSMFHQVQEGLHGLEHRVNPAKLVDIDFGSHKQSELVKHGLQIATFKGKQEFSEGVAGSGLINRLPGIGPYLQDYQNYLFGSYIPRLKMTMALDALDRNKKRYPNLELDQVYEITAKQANAAFGEQNYLMMGRNKTLQDVLRMGLLAPDFLESRAKFVGQAAKPYGQEQRIALLLGAAVMYIGARILNQLLDKDPHWASQDAFNVVAGDKSYSLRTIQGDILHAISDPRGFVYNRLNPVYGRSTIEAVTGRDEYGRKRTPGEQISDLVKQVVPIPAQGLMRSKPETITGTVLTSAGVSTAPYKSPAQRIADQYLHDSIPDTSESPEEQAASRKRSELVDNIRLGKQRPDALKNALDKGEITRRQFNQATAELAETPLETDVKRMSIEQALEVWDKANTLERANIAPLLMFKADSMENRTAGEQKTILPKLDAILGQYAGLRASGLPSTGTRAVEEELARLEAVGLKRPTTVEATIAVGNEERAPLSSQERLQYQYLKGDAMEYAFGQMIQDPEYRKMDDKGKVEAAQEAIRQASEYARDRMLAQLYGQQAARRSSGVPMEPPNVQ